MNSTITDTTFAAIIADRDSADLHAVNELQLWIDNTEPLYRQYQAIEVNYLRKIAKNTYDPALARKGWLHLVNAAYRDYGREMGIFPMSTATRRYAAHLIASDWEVDHTSEG